MFNQAGEAAWRQQTNLWSENIAEQPAQTDCDIRFQGQWFDEESGLHYNFHRYYDPQTGRYISNDPIGLEGASNTYAYVSNPLTWIDPFGLAGCNPTPARQARSWQGKGDYPGRDSWRTVTMKKGTKIYGGLPGQSEFYMSEGTVNASGLNRTRLWESVQVKPHDTFGYRPKVGEYVLTQDTRVAVSTTSANPQHGAGGGRQVFVPDFANKVNLIREVPLK